VPEEEFIFATFKWLEKGRVPGSSNGSFENVGEVFGDKKYSATPSFSSEG